MTAAQPDPDASRIENEAGFCIRPGPCPCEAPCRRVTVNTKWMLAGGKWVIADPEPAP